MRDIAAERRDIELATEGQTLCSKFAAAVARLGDAEALVDKGPGGERRALSWNQYRERVRAVTVADTPHVLMRWPIGRIAALAAVTKSALGPLLHGLTGVPGFIGDDGVPVPGSDLVAACDAIVPSLVERDPTGAGCGAHAELSTTRKATPLASRRMSKFIILLPPGVASERR